MGETSSAYFLLKIMAQNSDAPKTVEELTKQLETVTKERDDSKKQLEEAGAIIVDLKTRLSSAEAAPTAAGNPKFKIGQKTYEVLIPQTRIKGDVYTAAEIAKNKELYTYMVESGSEAVAEVK